MSCEHLLLSLYPSQTNPTSITKYLNNAGTKYSGLFVCVYGHEMRKALELLGSDKSAPGASSRGVHALQGYLTHKKHRPPRTLE